MTAGLSPISMICVTGQFIDSRISRDSAVWLMPVTINPAGFEPETTQELLLLQDAVAGIGELDAVAAALGRIVDAAQHVGEHAVGEGRDNDADDFRAVRSQRARGQIGT